MTWPCSLDFIDIFTYWRKFLSEDSSVWNKASSNDVSPWRCLIFNVTWRGCKYFSCYTVLIYKKTFLNKENKVLTNAGEANVQAEFTITDGRRKLIVAGCRCTKGLLQKKNRFRLVRNGEILIDGMEIWL